MSRNRIFHALLHKTSSSSRSLFPSPSRSSLSVFISRSQNLSFPSSSIITHHKRGKPTSPFASLVTPRLITTFSSEKTEGKYSEGCIQQNPLQDEGETEEEEEASDGWEEEDEAEPEIGDGGDGGGIVLQNVPWGESVLSIARQVLLQFGDDMELYAFKTTPRGYIYIRLDKLSNEYGCPSIEEIENYSQEYKKRLDEEGAVGKIPDNLALEVSSPGAERLLKVPDDLNRFKDMPVRICYVDEEESKCTEKTGIFLLENIDKESRSCTWKLANVKENRDALGKGRPLSRKQKDWRLQLPFEMFKNVSLYVE